MSDQELDSSEQLLIVDAARRASVRYHWYADLLQESGFFAEPSLSRIPVLEETDLAATYYSSTAPRSGTAYLTSGTSTGVPKRVVWPVRDHQAYVAHRAAVFAPFLGDSCRTGCADLGTGHAAASAREIFTSLGLRGSEIDVSWPVARHVEVLRETQPDFIYTMPMILERIVATGDLGYVPRRVAVLGDLAPAEWRQAIGKRLGMNAAQILDVLGSIEVGAIAYSDDQMGAYLFHSHIIPELTEDGLLVLTSLERNGFPAVRYVSGDVVTGLRRFDVQGREAWGYERHLGRRSDELKHGEMLSLHAIALAMAEIVPGATWDVRRDGLEAVVEVEPAAYSADAAERIRYVIRAAHPAVDQMIRSGLVGDIGVEPQKVGAAAPKRGAATRL
jgi:fumarate---(S)-2,3-diaminopropanoate ligase